MVAYVIWDDGEAFKSHIFYYGVISSMVEPQIVALETKVQFFHNTFWMWIGVFLKTSLHIWQRITQFYAVNPTNILHIVLLFMTVSLQLQALLYYGALDKRFKLSPFHVDDTSSTLVCPIRQRYNFAELQHMKTCAQWQEMTTNYIHYQYIGQYICLPSRGGEFDSHMVLLRHKQQTEQNKLDNS